MSNITEPSSRLNGWLLRLTEFNFEIKYKKGTENYHADELYCLLIGCPTVVYDDEEITTSHLGDENYLDILSSKRTSDQTIIQSAQPDCEFLELEYEEIDHLLTTCDGREDEP